MSGVGLEWYKRQPVAYLRDVQGMSVREHAVYSVILDTIYVHGGAINNDPKWISGWFSDMGPAAVRNTIAALVDRKILIIEGGKITQKRAKEEAKTTADRSKNSVKTQKKRPVFGEFSGGAYNENKDLDTIEKIREEYPLTPLEGGRGNSRFVGVPEGVVSILAKRFGEAS